MKKRDSILIVDDMEVNRAILCEVFQDEYRVIEAGDGNRALEILEASSNDIAVMLLDIVMPGKNGYQVLEEMRKRDYLSQIPVVVITSHITAESELNAFDQGAMDIITKPFEPNLVRHRVNNIVELYRHKLNLEDLVEEQADKLLKSNQALTDTLSTVIEYRSLESGQHVLRIRTFTKLLLTEVALQDPETMLDDRAIDSIAHASSMHDIGKIAIPDSILNKPGRLTPEEFEVMKTHSAKGEEILSVLEQTVDKEFLYYAKLICRYHHERWDGRGYPDGLVGDNIPLCAQVVGLADAYDALTTDRVYKAAYSPDKAYRMILNGECGCFSKRLLTCFEHVKDQFVQLTHEYADGRSPHSDVFVHRMPERREDGDEERNLDRQKYSALLRYLNAVVIELDLDRGTHRFVYSPNMDFVAFRKTSRTDAAMIDFAAESVHPDDREQVLNYSTQSWAKLFDSGIKKRSRHCRILCRETGAYRRYQLTLLRVETSYPKDHIGLVICAPDDDAKKDAAYYESLHKLLDTLNQDYEEIYINNLTNNSFLQIKSSAGDVVPAQPQPVFSDAILQESEQLVHPDDREFFRTECGLEEMQRYFSDREEKSFLYRRLASDGTYHMTEEHCVKAAGDGDFLVFSFLKDLEKGIQKEDIRTNGVLGVERFYESAQRKAGGDLSIAGQSGTIPAGMLYCLFDAPLTLLGYNESFLSLIGCTAQEVQTVYHNSFWNMIDPRDRDKALRLVLEQTETKSEKELTYRLATKKKEPIWVMDRGELVTLKNGEKAFCCILMDITEHMKKEEELRLSLERHQIIMDQTTDIIFEWNTVEDTFTYSPNWEKKFGYTPLHHNVRARIKSASHIHPEDQDTFVALLDKVKNGAAYAEAEFRIQTTAISYLWCRARLTGQQDETGCTIKAVGVIQDIDHEKRQNERLIEISQMDNLTNLYHKGTAKLLIETYLKQRKQQSLAALLMIDIDNFKVINDRFGHLFGDAFLVEAAKKLKELFRAGDIIGRIGGDEFIVCIKDVPDFDIVCRKAEHINSLFQGIMEETGQNFNVSCSVGISYIPYHGNSFHELYQKADIALYKAKKRGKNGYQVFDLSAEAGGSLPIQENSIRTRIESEDASVSKNVEIVEKVCKILYQSLDIDLAVPQILEIVGRYFDVSRAYIFENSEDNQYCSNTFEWCNDGIEPQIDNLQMLSYSADLHDHYHNNFNENGVFYCRDIRELTPEQVAILAPQKVKSMLQCAIYNDGVFQGFVGFDDCQENRFWTQDQIETLTFLAEILSVFLMKKRAQHTAEQFAQDIKAILDHQSKWIYVIRPDTYELLYINEKTHFLLPDAQGGMTCHQAFFHCGHVCDICPVRRLPKKANGEFVIWNPVIGMWIRAEYSTITWKGEDAVLLSCEEDRLHQREQAEPRP